MFTKTLRFQYLLVALILGFGIRPALGQEQIYEHGRIVQVDERGEALDFLEEEEVIVDDSLPWCPVLSPVMICLDCWIGKTLKIHDHYSQQAAERYFAYVETCTDIPLGLDSGRGTNLKYTLLAPFYAGCPSLLQNGGGFGRWGGGGYGATPQYGFQEPMPSPVTTGPGGTTLMSPTPSSGMDLMPKETAPGLVPSVPGIQEVPGMPSAPAVPGASGLPNQVAPGSVQAQPIGQVAGGSKWANMSDAEILNYFGLDSAAKDARTAELVGELDQPVAPASTWEFADQSPATSAAKLMAQSSAPALDEKAIPAAPADSAKNADTVKDGPNLEDLKEIVGDEKKPFSVTDKEYEKMREIEGNLLEDL